jgi:3-deoxy-D-manno-octulosonic-acid transferase
LELLYTALLYIIQPLVWLRLLLRSRKAPAYRKRWAERYGFCRNKVAPDGILLHSVSVGETLAAIPLVRALRHRYPSLPITVTTMTPTGSERALSAFGKDASRLSALRSALRHESFPEYRSPEAGDRDGNRTVAEYDFRPACP